MGVHQEFAGCLVRMGCNASHRTTGRYVCVNIRYAWKHFTEICCSAICFSFYFIVCSLMVQAKKAVMYPCSYNT